MTSNKTNVRVEILRGMHENMRQVNNEVLYYTWTMVFVDEPNEEDFIDTAEDDEHYGYVTRRYKELQKLDKEI